MMTRMRRWVATAVLAAVLVGGGVAWAMTHGSASTTKYLTASVARGSVAQTIAATGTVQPGATVALSFGGSTVSSGSGAANGTGGTSSTSGGSARNVSSGSTDVTSVAARVGEKVAAGTELATLDDTAARAQLTGAQAQLSSAQARQSADAATATAATVASDASAIAQAEQQVENAQAAVDATVLTAPVSGVITEVDVSKGLPSTSPAIVVRTGSLRVVASVSENDITSLSAGQKATVDFPALSASTSGTVGTLPTAANSGSSGGAVTFPVTINLPHPPVHLLPGMTAQISVVIAQRDNVLSVPTSALAGSPSAPSVQVLVAGKPVNRPVEIGLSTNSTTEIIAGLTPGQTVVTGEVNPTETTNSAGTGGGLGGAGGGFRGGGGLGGAGGGFRNRGGLGGGD